MSAAISRKICKASFFFVRPLLPSYSRITSSGSSFFFLPPRYFFHELSGEKCDITYLFFFSLCTVYLRSQPSKKEYNLTVMILFASERFLYIALVNFSFQVYLLCIYRRVSLFPAFRYSKTFVFLRLFFLLSSLLLLYHIRKLTSNYVMSCKKNATLRQFQSILLSGACTYVSRCCEAYSC